MTVRSLIGPRGIDGERRWTELEPVDLNEDADSLGFASVALASERRYDRASPRFAALLGFDSASRHFARGSGPVNPYESHPASKVRVYREPRSRLLRQARARLVVRFSPARDYQDIRMTLARFGARVVGGSAYVETQVIAEGGALEDPEEAFAIAAHLSEQEEVVFATPSFLSQYRRTAPVHNPQQWHLENACLAAGQTLGEDVRAVPAWRSTLGAATMVAVIDDGVDVEHPSLADRVWMDPDDPNCRGRDFFVAEDDPEHYNPRPKTWNHPFDDRDGNDIHGTPCAGLIGANGAHGVAGVAPECTLLPVKIFHASRPALDERIAEAIRFAGLKAGAHVISCSWEGGSNPDVEQAIIDVMQLGRDGLGCVVVCSAGNGHGASVAFPAHLPGVIAVGASTDRGDVAPYSNHGADLALVAPSDGGVLSVYTTDVSNLGRGYNPKGLTTDRFSGTSAATATVAGSAALLLSARPTLRAGQVREILLESADRIGAVPYRNHRNDVFGAGRVNVERALRELRNWP